MEIFHLYFKISKRCEWIEVLKVERSFSLNLLQIEVFNQIFHPFDSWTLNHLLVSNLLWATNSNVQPVQPKADP